MNQSFWQGKRVFLTGHTGFKGGWLSLWLQHLGADLTGFALPAEDPSLFARAQISEGMQSIAGDIRNLSSLANAMRSCQAEIVIHLAAQSLVRPSYEDPVTTFATNVMGTINVFEAARRAGSVRAIVNVTSDKCYENQEWHWAYRESDPLGGYDPYSCSKACSELATDAYRRSFLDDAGIAVATGRAGNVIGGGDWARNRLVPDLIRGFLDGTSTVVRCPESTRPWQHVCEPLHGYLLLAENLWGQGRNFAESWNFGPSEESEAPVSQIADSLAAAWGNGASWIRGDGDHPHEAGRLKLDSNKARVRLNWRPQLDLPTTLEWTLDWYGTERQKSTDMRRKTDEQIINYLGICGPD